MDHFQTLVRGPLGLRFSGGDGLQSQYFSWCTAGGLGSLEPKGRFCVMDFLGQLAWNLQLFDGCAGGASRIPVRSAFTVIVAELRSILAC